MEGALVSWNGAYQTTMMPKGVHPAHPRRPGGDIIVERPDGGATRVQAVQVEEGRNGCLTFPPAEHGPNLSPTAHS